MIRTINLPSLLIMISLFLATTGCKKSVDGCVLGENFSITIVDENGADLLNPEIHNNIVNQIKIELVYGDGKVIPLDWTPQQNVSNDPGYPGFCTNAPSLFAYSDIDKCLVVGTWNNEINWSTAFQIRLPEYGIELNVTGRHRGVNKGSDWWVNDNICHLVPISDEYFLYANYKLVLPIKE